MNVKTNDHEEKEETGVEKFLRKMRVRGRFFPHKLYNRVICQFLMLVPMVIGALSWNLWGIEALWISVTLVGVGLAVNFYLLIITGIEDKERRELRKESGSGG